MSDKSYKIPIEWKVRGYYHFHASSLEEAIEIAKDDPLPFGNYLEESDQLDWEGIKEVYPDEWKNEKLVKEYQEYIRDFMEKTKAMINCLLPATYDQWRANKLTDTTITTNRVEEIMENE